MKKPRSFRFMALAAGMAVVTIFPAAALAAWLYRFPIPFVGYASGAGAVWPSLRAVAFYGTLTGGFFILAGLGAIGGWLTRFLVPTPGDPGRRTRWSLGLGAGLAVGTVALLAVLDRIIGPW